MAISGPGDGFVKEPWTLKPTGRSMFGRQADSRKQTAPTYNFNSVSGRDQHAKVFLSQSHVEVDRKCREGPAHIYKVPGALGKQEDARKLSLPSYSFSHAERLKARSSDTPPPGAYKTTTALGEQPLSPNRSPERVLFGSSSREQAQKVFLTAKHLNAQKGQQGPPPGTYTLPGAMGTQLASTKSTSPAFSLSKTDRLKNKYEELSKTLPAVGQYDTWQSIGKQTLSLAKTMPAYAFGSSNRDKEALRFLTTGHVNERKGTLSPGNYDHQTQNNISSFGRQSLSRKGNVPAYGFGSTPKNVFKVSDTPGPGSYD